MDLSAFWMIFCMEFVVYGLIWGQHDSKNGLFLRKMFYFIAVPATVFLLFMFYDLGKRSLDLQFVVHSFAVLAPLVVFYYLFNRLLISEADDAKKEEAEKVRFNALSPADKKKELAAKELRARIDSEVITTSLYGAKVAALVCPHCQNKGSVRRKTGMSSEVALTTSNTYKAKVQTKMHCDNCATEWVI